MSSYYFLERESWSIEGVTGRCFFQFPFEFERSTTEAHIAQIPEIEDVKVWEAADAWIVRFTFCGQRFYLDNHGHGTTTSFIVAYSDCADEILVQVLGLFASAMKIAADDSQPMPVTLTGRKTTGLLARMLKWLQ